MPSINLRLIGWLLPVLLMLAGCSVLPGGDDTETLPEEAAVSSRERGEPPPGLDLSAPNQNPYLTEAPEVPDAALNQFQRALAAIDTEDWQTAEILLEQLTVEYPTLSGPHLNLGIIYRHFDNDELAEQAFSKAITVNPKNLQAYNQLALLQRQQGRFAEAQANYEKALTVWPKHAASHKNLGILFDLYMGKWSDALRHFEIYQYLQDEPEQQVTGWIIDLQRRIEQRAQN